MQIYRVRKSFEDLKSQKGVYFILNNAIEKAQKTKCNVYAENKKCVWKYEKTGGKNK